MCADYVMGILIARFGSVRPEATEWAILVLLMHEIFRAGFLEGKVGCALNMV